MIEDCRVCFSNGNTVDAKRVRIKDSGWVSVQSMAEDGWVYYPPRQVDRIISRE